MKLNRALITSAILFCTSAVSTAQVTELEAKTRLHYNHTVQLDLTVTGRPNGLAVIALSTGTLSTPIRLPWGLLYLDPRAMVTLPPITLDANGKGTMTTAVPLRLYSIGSQVTPFQALAAGVTNPLELTNPVQVGFGFSPRGAYAVVERAGCVEWQQSFAGSEEVFEIEHVPATGPRSVVKRFTVPSPPPPLINLGGCAPLWRTGDRLVLKRGGRPQLVVTKNY